MNRGLYKSQGVKPLQYGLWNTDFFRSTRLIFTQKSSEDKTLIPNTLRPSLTKKKFSGVTQNGHSFTPNSVFHLCEQFCPKKLKIFIFSFFPNFLQNFIIKFIKIVHQVFQAKTKVRRPLFVQRWESTWFPVDPSFQALEKEVASQMSSKQSKPKI